MTHLAAVGGFLSGVGVGLVVGVVLAPVLRFWLTWREWERASREARLTEDAIKRMGDGPWRLLRARVPSRAGHPAPNPDGS